MFQPEIINLRTTVAANAESIISETVRQKGVLTRVTMHFPPGASALVDVAVRAQNEQIVPVEGFIALDDATQTFSIARAVEAGNEVSARIRNADGANPHTISVIIENTPRAIFDRKD